MWLIAAVFQSQTLSTGKVLQLPWCIAAVKRDHFLSWKFTSTLTCEFRFTQHAVHAQRGDICSMKTSGAAVRVCVHICLPRTCVEYVRERITPRAAAAYPPPFEGVRLPLCCKWATEAQPPGPHTHTQGCRRVTTPTVLNFSFSEICLSWVLLSYLLLLHGDLGRTNIVRSHLESWGSFGNVVSEHHSPSLSLGSAVYFCVPLVVGGSFILVKW